MTIWPKAINRRKYPLLVLLGCMSHPMNIFFRKVLHDPLRITATTKSVLPSWSASRRVSPRAHLHVVGMLRFVFDTNRPSLPTPFYSVLVSVSVNCISFHKFSLLLFTFTLCPSDLFSPPYWSIQLYISYENLFQS